MNGFPGLAADLRADGRAVALVTSPPPGRVGMAFDRFDLRECFDAVVSADAFDGPGKPEPGVYRHAADRLGVEPRVCVAVEDSGHGVASAAGAGMSVVGYRPDGDVPEADAVVDGPAALREWLLGDDR